MNFHLEISEWVRSTSGIGYVNSGIKIYPHHSYVGNEYMISKVLDVKYLHKVSMHGKV